MTDKKFGFLVVEKPAAAFITINAKHLAEAVKEAGKIALHDYLIIKLRDGRSLLLSDEDRKEAVRAPQTFIKRMAKLFSHAEIETG